MARSKHPSHLYRRGDIFYFCCRVPSSQSILRASLRTGDKAVAQGIASHLAYMTKQGTICDLRQLQHCIANATRSIFQPDIINQDITSTEATSSSFSDKSSFKTLITEFLEEATKLGTWRSKHKKDMENALNVFLEIVGNFPIEEFDLSKALCYREGLMNYPYKRHDTKIFQGKTLTQIQEMPHKTISLTTASNHARKVKTFCNWLVENGHLKRNPLSKIQIKKVQSDKEAVRPFSESEINRLFSSEIYMQKKYVHPYHYWLPLLGYYTGARIEELCQLHTNDVVITEGHYCIRIDDKYPGQKLKSLSSRRMIPIHPHLLELGLIEFASEKKLANEQRLFAELNKIGGTEGQFSHAASKWFGRYRRRMGLTSSKTVFHSFRHGFIDHLRANGSDIYIIKNLVGHSTNGTTDTVYGGQIPPSQTWRVVSLIPRLTV